jgi:hypothetical protein
MLRQEIDVDLEAALQQFRESTNYVSAHLVIGCKTWTVFPERQV